jgi:hypothetical protein
MRLPDLTPECDVCDWMAGYHVIHHHDRAPRDEWDLCSDHTEELRRSDNKGWFEVLPIDQYLAEQKSPPAPEVREARQSAGYMQAQVERHERRTSNWRAAVILLVILLVVGLLSSWRVLGMGGHACNGTNGHVDQATGEFVCD